MGTLLMQLTDAHHDQLFLTTNRVGTFDAAFLSRIPVKLPNRKETCTFRSAIPHKEKNEIFDCVNNNKGKKSELESKSLDGREIVNLCETALSIAQHEAQETAKDEGGRDYRRSTSLELGAIHFEAAMDLSTGFDFLYKIKEPAAIKWDKDDWKEPRAKDSQPKPARRRSERLPSHDVDYGTPYQPSTTMREGALASDESYYPQPQEGW
ncbi:hypothetical protein BJX64DRAFT_289250 [Aspergillus heterothallicus]